MNQMLLKNGRSTPRFKFKQVAEKYMLSDRQVAYARLAGVRTEAEFYSFLLSARELGESSLFDTPDLTERLARSKSVQVLAMKFESASLPEEVAFGATAPYSAPFQRGDQAPEMSRQELQSLAAFEVGPLSEEEVVGVSMCGPWPVRNQGARGTCVAFATTALAELHLCRTKAVWNDLSEQFLYWAIKHYGLDSIPTQDGTWHKFAVLALARYGICDESTWPYSPTVVSPVSHDPPPPGAISAATAQVVSGGRAVAYSSRSGKAAKLLKKLKKHNGVAIALPVFESPNGTVNNWSTRVAQTYGEVQNPLPGWVVSGGHAVCCVGFTPDPDEPLGGHFIIRNSWGTGWGNALPDPSYAGPEPGYGQVSASYVDRYLWEDCVF